MSFVVKHSTDVPVVTGIGRGFLALRTLEAWSIEDNVDGHEHLTAVVLAPTALAGVGCTYAHRIAELLNRHGMVDVPDGVSGEVLP